MSYWIILATGQSLLNSHLSLVKFSRKFGSLPGAIAVSTVGLDKAPWANYLVSGDSHWWMANPEAESFAGEKYARLAQRNVTEFRSTPQATNSGLMAMHLAKVKDASQIILLGFDMHGTHYFGPYTRKWVEHLGDVLMNTAAKRFQVHIAEFKN